MSPSVVKKILDYFAIILIAATGLFLWNNISYFSVPDPDIFQYVYDSRQYAAGQIPQSIQTPPLNSLLIAALKPLLKSYEYPEITAAHLINIIATIFSLLLIYQITKSYSKIIGICVMLATITNPTVLFSSLNINTEVLFTTFILLTVFLYQRSKITLASLVAGLSFLVRYEGILLAAALIFIDLIHAKKIKRTIRSLIFALVPIVSWLCIIFQRNYLGTLTGNAYIQEIIQYKQNIPQLLLLHRTPYILIDYIFANINIDFHSYISFFLTIIVYSSILIVFSKNNPITQVIYLFSFLYMIFHLFFPFAPDRYLYPVIWSLYLAPGLFLLRSHFLHFFLSVILLVSAGNATRIRDYYRTSSAANTAYPGNYRSEIRLAANWLNKQIFDRPIIVVAYDHGIPSFYTHNNKVFYLDIPYSTYQECDSIECLIQTSEIDTSTHDVFFLQQSNTFLTDDSFPSAINYNARIFNQFPTPEEKNNFVLLAHLSKYDSWAKIYEYRPSE